MREIAIDAIIWYNLFVLLYFLTINFSYLGLLFLATNRLVYFNRRRRTHICSDKHCKLLPSIALLVPAYNEERIIADHWKVKLFSSLISLGGVCGVNSLKTTK